MVRVFVTAWYDLARIKKNNGSDSVNEVAKKNTPRNPIMVLNDVGASHTSIYPKQDHRKIQKNTIVHKKDGIHRFYYVVDN